MQVDDLVQTGIEGAAEGAGGRSSTKLMPLALGAVQGEFAGRQLRVDHSIDRSRHGVSFSPEVNLQLREIKGIETYLDGFTR